MTLMKLMNACGPSFHGREYIIEEMIDKGSFGYVYKAKQVKSKYYSPALQDLPLALKIYHYSHASYQRSVLDEIRHMAAMTLSPYSVQFFDRSPPNEKPEYLVMEYVPETLDQRRLNLPEDYTIHKIVKLYLQQMPSIIQNLWDAQVVHCDFKLSNIGFKDGHLKLLDFGLARGSGIASAKDIPQKRAIYPPEAQDGIITPYLDIFCAGKVLERLLVEQYTAQVQETIEAIEFYHDILLPVSWRQMLLSMLHPDYERRPNPAQLHHLMANAAADMDAFKFKDFVPLNKAELLPSSSSFLPG